MVSTTKTQEHTNFSAQGLYKGQQKNSYTWGEDLPMLLRVRFGKKKRVLLTHYVRFT